MAVGSGVTPTLPNFKDVYGLDAAVITGVDLLKGIGALQALTLLMFQELPDTLTQIMKLRENMQLKL